MSRGGATTALRLLAGTVGRDSEKYALQSGRIGWGAAVGEPRGVGNPDPTSREVKIGRFMVRVRPGGERANFVSQALKDLEEHVG